MSVVTTVLTRIAKRERKQKKSNRIWSALMVAGLLLIFVIGGVAAVGPRVAPGTVIFGIDLSRMPADEAAQALQAAFNESAAVSFVNPGVTLQRTLAAAGLKPDFQAIVRQTSSWTWWLGKPAAWKYRGSFDSDALTALVGQIEERLPRPKDARLVAETDTVWIQPSVDGLAVDTEALKKRLSSLFENPATSIEVPLLQGGPETTTDDVKAMGINRLLGSYTTIYVEDGARSENIKLAASKISGTIIRPGETISFNNMVGPRRQQDGYKEANVYFDNKVERGFGGGVCQVSTTLYNAALLSNLEIIERHPHSLTVDYVPLGQDASVVYELLDLVLKNNTPGHILITAETRPGSLTFRVFGGGPQVDVKIEPVVLYKTEFEVETVIDPHLAPGTQQITNGKNGYRVATYKIVTDLADPQKPMTRTLLNYSNYKPMKQTIREGIQQ